MRHTTPRLSEAQYEWLTNELPEPCHLTGRRPVPNRDLLPGILYVLSTGCRWSDLPESICTYNPSTCWRRLRYWSVRQALVPAWQELLKQLSEEGKIDLDVGVIDGPLIQSPKFKSGTGYSGKHKRTGTNVVLTTEKNGIPLTSVSGKGNRHDLHLALKAVLKIRVGARRKVKKMNADKGFDSTAFRRSLRKQEGNGTQYPRADIQKETETRQETGLRQSSSHIQGLCRANNCLAEEF